MPSGGYSLTTAMYSRSWVKPKYDVPVRGSRNPPGLKIVWKPVVHTAPSHSPGSILPSMTGAFLSGAAVASP